MLYLLFFFMFLRARRRRRHYLSAVPTHQMMAKENQAVTGELARLGAERDENRRKLGDALHQQATSEQVGTPRRN